MNNPEHYKHANGIQRRDAVETISEYIGLLEWHGDNDAVLDVGCGIGDVTLDLLKPRLPAKARLVGADLAPEMVKYAAQRYPGEEFIVLDIGAKQIPRHMHETFEHVFSFYCFHWIKNQRQAMQNIYNILKPGGDVLMCFLATNPIYDIYLNMAKSPKWKMHMKDLHKYISPYHFIKDVEGKLRKILTDVGFEITVCECKKKMFEYENLNIVRKAVTAVNPFCAKLTDIMKEQFINDYITELNKMKLCEINNNSKLEVISIVYKLIIVCVRKPTM